MVRARVCVCMKGEQVSLYHIDGYCLFHRDGIDQARGGVSIYVQNARTNSVGRFSRLENDHEAVEFVY